MNEKNKLEIYESAIDLYGKTHQICKFLEEGNELIQAFLKNDYENEIEETADCVITLEQTCILFNCLEKARAFNYENDQSKSGIIASERIQQLIVDHIGTINLEIFNKSDHLIISLCHLHALLRIHKSSFEKHFNQWTEYKLNRLDKRIKVFIKGKI